jgi:hypothetical protein
MGMAMLPGSNGSSQRFLACGLRADLTLDRWITLRVSSIRILKVMACPTDSLIQRDIREVTIGNHPCFVSAVMLAVIDKMGMDLLVSCRRWCSVLVAQISEGIIFRKLRHLKVGSLSP